MRHPTKKLKEHDNNGLPVPRLEIRYKDTADPEKLRAEYGLVYRHLCDHLVFATLGLTKIHGALHYYRDRLDLPFRDGAHIRHEMKTLNLRAFVVYGQHHRELFEGDHG